VSRGVRRLCTVPLTCLSASPATRQAVPTLQANGAHLPERTVPGPWASGRLAFSMQTEAVVGQGAKRARALGRSWLPCVRGVAGAASRWTRHAWRGTTGTGTICSIAGP
jgi:hypothetical protein